MNQKLIKYTGFAFGIDNDTCCGNYYPINGEGLFSESEIAGAYTSIPTYNPKEFYSYFNEEKILERLYETGTCDKQATEEANIHVLVGDKWVYQEQSWNPEKKIATPRTFTIIPDKQYLYNAKNAEKTKMYLIKGDQVEVLRENEDWLYILYHGKKEILAWIPMSAVGYED